MMNINAHFCAVTLQRFETKLVVSCLGHECEKLNMNSGHGKKKNIYMINMLKLNE